MSRLNELGPYRKSKSEDRIHFTISNIYLMRSNIRDCLVESLGISMSQLLVLSQTEQDLHIVCRPSQFARFIVLRHVKYNEPNNIACLNMKLVMVPIEDEVVDVSCNSNTAGYSHTTCAVK